MRNARVRRPAADGGATRLDNLVLLCQHHHRLLHEGRYYVVKDGAHFIFCRGDGEEVPPGRETPLEVLIERARGRMPLAHPDAHASPVSLAYA